MDSFFGLGQLEAVAIEPATSDASVYNRNRTGDRVHLEKCRRARQAYFALRQRQPPSD